MDRIKSIISAIDHSLSSRRKRHITGGALLSISLFFGGLAFTIMTIKQEEYDEQNTD